MNQAEPILHISRLQSHSTCILTQCQGKFSFTSFTGPNVQLYFKANRKLTFGVIGYVVELRLLYVLFSFVL